MVMQAKAPHQHRASDLLALAPLTAVLERIRTHEAILRHIREWLPHPLAEHCLDCVVSSNRRLILYVDSQAWAFQLRFHAPALLEKVASVSGGFRGIDVRTLPASETRRRATPMPATAPHIPQLVLECAQATGSSDLASALARLAATLGSQSGNTDTAPA